MHNQTQNPDGSARFIEAEGSKESLRLNNGGAEFYGAAITFGAEGAGAADSIDVSIQLTDRQGRNLAKQVLLRWYTATAGTLAQAITGTTWSVVTGVLADLATSNSSPRNFLTDATGLAVIRLTVTGALTRDMIVILPDGRVVAGATMTWAA